MKNKFKSKHIIYFVIIYLLIFFNKAYAKIYTEIKVSGNERLPLETITMFSGLNIKNEIDRQDLNSAIKNL